MGPRKLRILCKKFVIVIVYFKKKERSQINNLTVQLKKLYKEYTVFKASRRKGIIKIRVEITKIQNGKIREKINETKSWFFEKDEQN